METKNKELVGFVEDLKMRNDDIYDSDFAKQLSAAKLLRELD
ncbi:hypothetical protein LCGC14_1241440 [marine sediment metagenome]|uniref:Uncharacterized protein n=1 Tax=marine sediment metagenome TaxID=412755 RepID=A0A0F9LSW2_9ZZZZ